MCRERVPLELVQGVRAGARHDAGELAERPGEPAVDRVPGAAHEHGVAAADPAVAPARSVTAGSAAAGDCEEPIRAGPPSAAGAPTPVRKRRIFATSVAPAPGSGAPARMFPRLRLTEDHAGADLPVAGVPARVPARPVHSLRCAAGVARRGGAAASAKARSPRARRARPGAGRRRRAGPRRASTRSSRGSSREVGPVTGGVVQIPAVRPAQRLLVGVRQLQVTPERGGAAAAEGHAAVEERQIAGGEPVLGGGPQQPQVEVVRGPASSACSRATVP